VRGRVVALEAIETRGAGVAPLPQGYPVTLRDADGAGNDVLRAPRRIVSIGGGRFQYPGGRPG
jgi:hypothetical protein